MVNFHRKPVSFHAVSFGSDTLSGSLRRMAKIARAAQNNAPSGSGGLPAIATVLSSYTKALDTVRLSDPHRTCADRFNVGATGTDIPWDRREFEEA